MTGRWFRFYDDAVNDPKLIRLSDGTYRFWVGILCLASKNGGSLPAIEDIAVVMRMKPDTARKNIEKLITAGLIDAVEGDSLSGLSPHNWSGRQYKSDVSTERVKRYRNAQRNVSETPPETEQIQNTEKEKKGPPEGATVISVDFAPQGSPEDQFWSLAGAASEKGIARNRLGQLAQLHGGDFAAALRVLQDALKARVPSSYFGKIVSALKEEQRVGSPAFLQDENVPEFVRRAKADRIPVERRKEGGWRIGGDIVNDFGEVVGW